MAIVNEVITQFGFKGSAKPLTNYNAALGQSIKFLGASALAIKGLTVAFQAFVFRTTAALDPMIQLSRTTGVAVETMQELGFAASVSGSSLEAVQSSMGGLSEKIGEAAQRGSEDFARLGISVRKANGDVKSADEVFGELGKRFKDLDLSLGEQRSFAQKLGIDSTLIQLLNKSGAEVDALRVKAKALGVVSGADANLAASLNDSLTTLKFGFGAVQNAIAIGFAPQLKEMTSGFIDFLIANKTLITEGISKTISFVFELAKAMKRLMPVLVGIGLVFAASQVAAIGFGTVMATIFSPVVLITAGIVALLLIVDDLIVAFHGGNSVIANFFQSFGIDIVPVLQVIVDAFLAMMDRIIAIWTSIGSIFGDVFSAAIALVTGDFDGFFNNIMSAFKGVVDFLLVAFKPILKNVVTAFNDMMASLISIFKKIGAIFADTFSAVISLISGDFDGFFNNIMSAFKGVVDFLLVAFKPITALISAATGFIGSKFASFFGLGGGDKAQQQTQTQDQRISAGSTNQTNSNINNSIQQDVNIEIKTSDPLTAGASVGAALNDQLADTQTQFSRGGL